MTIGIEHYPERVQRIIRFCEMLSVPDGDKAGERVTLRQWQRDLIADVYGPRNDAGRRIVREALLTMGRKNGKTALISMLVLVHLCGPEAIRNGQLYSVAFSREQASVVFKYASNMVYASEFLSSRLNVVETQKKLYDPISGSMYHALSAESRSKHGLSSSFIVFDELAQFNTDRELYKTMMTSRGAHAEPLVWFISTQAKSDLALFSELVDKGKSINAGELVNPAFKSFIYEVPPEADIFDESNWYLANPALGDFNNLELMREEAQKAKESPSEQQGFRNLYMNQRVNADTSFVSLETWRNNGGTADDDIFESGRPCYGGLDLSSKNDLTALVFVCMDDDKRWHARPYFWTAKDGLRLRSDQDKVPYDQWVKQGLITATPGSVIDYELVAAFLGDCLSRFNIQAIRFDRWRIKYLRQELHKLSVPCWVDGVVDGVRDEPVPGGLRLIPYGQGFKDMAPAVDRLDDLLRQGRILHGMNPILTWCSTNVAVEVDDAGNRKFSKKKSTGRIDGIVALAMAVARTEDVEDDGQGSIEELYASEPIVINW